MTNLDIALNVAATVALQIPDAKQIGRKKLAGRRVSFGYTGKEAETALAIFNAIAKKHLAPGTRGKPQDARQTARALVLDILVQKANWKPFPGIIASFAERNDRDFFEQLGRGLYRQRKPVFDELDWFLVLNWHGWTEDSWRNWNNPDIRDKLQRTADKIIGEFYEFSAYNSFGKGFSFFGQGDSWSSQVDEPFGLHSFDHFRN